MSDRTRLIRNLDSKGRITLGEKFANRTVIVEERKSGEFILRLARVVPEPEGWLYDNRRALSSVRRGLAQAKAGKFGPPPNLGAAARLAARLPDNEG
jgi:hypothetical protein